MSYTFSLEGLKNDYLTRYLSYIWGHIPLHAETWF